MQVTPRRTSSRPLRFLSDLTHPISLTWLKIPMTVFFVLPQSFDLCLLCHAFDGMRRWELAFSLRRAAHGLTPGVFCEPNRSMDDMKSTWGVYEGAYTCWVAILWMQVQNPKVIGSFILTIICEQIKNRLLEILHSEKFGFIKRSCHIFFTLLCRFLYRGGD